MSRSTLKKRKSAKGNENEPKRIAIGTGKSADVHDEITWIPTTTACYICQRVQDDDLTILCDGEGCSKEVHMYCLNPPLLRIPSEQWYCDTCSPLGTTRRLRHYFQQHNHLKSQFMKSVGDKDEEIDYSLFLSSLVCRIEKLENLHTVLDRILPDSEFAGFSLVGCRVDIYDDGTNEIHTGRILAVQTLSNCTQHLVQFKSGINGRNAPLIVWMVLHEHISLVYRDVFMLRYGHSCMWQPVQCILRSGLFRLYDSNSRSSYSKRNRPVAFLGSLSSSKSKVSKSSSSATNNQIGENMPLIEKVDLVDENEVQDASSSLTSPSDLVFFSFLQPEIIRVNSVAPSHCRPLHNLDYHSIRLSKATLVAIMEARAEIEEQGAVRSQVRLRSLQQLETHGLLDIDSGNVDLPCLLKIADQYSHWKGITLPFGMTSNAYGSFAKKRSSGVSAEDEQRENYRNDIEIFVNVENILAEHRLYRMQCAKGFSNAKSLPNYADKADKTIENAASLSKGAATCIEESVENEGDSFMGNVEIAMPVDIEESNVQESEVNEGNSVMGNVETAMPVDIEANTVQEINSEKISDRIMVDAVTEESKEKSINQTPVAAAVIEDEEQLYEHRLQCRKLCEEQRNFSVDESTELDSQKTARDILMQFAVDSDVLGNATINILAPVNRQSQIQAPSSSWTHIAEAICCRYDRHIAEELAQQEADRLEKLRQRKAAAALARLEKQRKQKEGAEKRRQAVLKRKMARSREALVEEDLSGTESPSKSPQSGHPTTFNSASIPYNNNARPSRTSSAVAVAAMAELHKKKVNRMLSVSEMIMDDLGQKENDDVDREEGEENDNDESNWKLLEMDAKDWKDPQSFKHMDTESSPPSRQTRLLSTLKRSEWLDQVVRNLQNKSEASVSSSATLGRVVGCDAGLAIVKWRNNVLQQVDPAQLQIMEIGSREYIRFEMADAVDADDAERLEGNAPPQHQAGVGFSKMMEDYGDQLLLHSDEIPNDFIPAFFAFDDVRAPASLLPTAATNGGAGQDVATSQPVPVKRKPPPPERKARVIDFSALLTNNEDRTVSVPLVKKPARQPLLQAVKLDQMKKLSAASAPATTASSFAGSSALVQSGRQSQANEGSKPAVVGTTSSLPSKSSTITTTATSSSASAPSAPSSSTTASNTTTAAANSTSSSARSSNFANMEIKKYGRGVGSTASHVSHNNVSLKDTKFVANSATIAPPVNITDNSVTVQSHSAATAANSFVPTSSDAAASHYAVPSLPSEANQPSSRSAATVSGGEAPVPPRRSRFGSRVDTVADSFASTSSLMSPPNDATSFSADAQSLEPHYIGSTMIPTPSNQIHNPNHDFVVPSNAMSFQSGSEQVPMQQPSLSMRPGRRSRFSSATTDPSPPSFESETGAGLELSLQMSQQANGFILSNGSTECVMDPSASLMYFNNNTASSSDMHQNTFEPYGNQSQWVGNNGSSHWNSSGVSFTAPHSMDYAAMNAGSYDNSHFHQNYDDDRHSSSFGNVYVPALIGDTSHSMGASNALANSHWPPTNAADVLQPVSSDYETGYRIGGGFTASMVDGGMSTMGHVEQQQQQQYVPTYFPGHDERFPGRRNHNSMVGADVAAMSSAPGEYSFTTEGSGAHSQKPLRPDATRSKERPASASSHPMNIARSSNAAHDGLSKNERRRLRRMEKHQLYQHSVRQLDDEMSRIGSVLADSHSPPTSKSTALSQQHPRFTIEMNEVEDGEVVD